MNHISHFHTSKEVCSVCLGIEPKGFVHCGILYNTGRDSYFIHLGNPFGLFAESFKEYSEKRRHYFWSPFENLHISKQNLIRTKCIAIAERNKDKHFDYGIYNSDKTTFDAKGNLVLGGKNNTGLTCATFIKVVLKSSNVNIIDETDWPNNREDDQEWLGKLISLYEKWLSEVKLKFADFIERNKTTPIGMEGLFKLQRTKYNSEIDTLTRTIKGLKRGIGICFMRFRPEEVCGASYQNAKVMPLKFEYHIDLAKEGAKVIGENLLNKLKLSYV